MALDLTAGRNGLAKLGEVMTLWIRHMLGIDVEIEPLNEMRDVSFNWYLVLDAAGTRIGDALCHGHDLHEQSPSSVVGLYQLDFKYPDVVDLRVRDQPVCLIIA